MKKILLYLAIVCCLFTACKPSTAADPSTEPDTETSEELVFQGESADQTAPTFPGTPDAPVYVKPLPSTLDLNDLTDCTLAISLDGVREGPEGDIFLDVTVYTYDLYDMVDISRLEEGSVILLGNEEVVIESLEWTDYGDLRINGGLDAGGYDLRTDENTVYYQTGYSDMKAWYEVGSVTLPLSDGFLFTDSSRLDGGDVTYTATELLALEPGCTPYNTTIVVEGGYVTAMTKVYTP